ncbi:uncharacterized protein [Solanum lycopersicum]|uniref:uncharacterized protein n=1 Tax=Solanum lycopersicum TaxID=4081 RepID=UPI003747EEA0
MLVTGPTGRYYLLEDDSSIRTLQSALSSQFSVLQLFAVDEGEATVVIPNICDLNKPYAVVPVEVATDCESNDEDEDQNEPVPSDYNIDELENNPKYSVNDMRQDLDDNFNLNVSYSKMKRVKRLVLEKLEGSYIDEFNKLEGYAQELRDNNPVVDIETLRTWKWFIELLRNSLDLADGEGVTFMSDMHKGLLNAVSQVFPKEHHIWCARHIEANWSKDWKSVQMKKLLWLCAWSTYEEEFHDQLKFMGCVSKQAAKDLVMNRLQKLEEEGRNWNGEFSPYAIELYNDFNIIGQCCQVQSNGDKGYEVVEGEDSHVVNLNRKKCTCRTWDLTGIPCPHAIKAYLHDKQEPLDQLSWWYSKEAYMLIYMHKIQPVRGDKFLKPPEIHKLVGRPKHKRKREKDEAREREGVWFKD